MNSTNQSKWIGPIALVAAGVFLLAAGLLVSLVNRSDQPSTDTNSDPSNTVERVLLDEAFQAYQEGSAVLVDVRSVTSFESGHIPGSLSIPISEIERRASELNPDDWIITICA